MYRCISFYCDNLCMFFVCFFTYKPCNVLLTSNAQKAIQNLNANLASSSCKVIIISLSLYRLYSRYCSEIYWNFKAYTLYYWLVAFG